MISRPTKHRKIFFEIICLHLFSFNLFQKKEGLSWMTIFLLIIEILLLTEFFSIFFVGKNANNCKLKMMSMKYNSFKSRTVSLKISKHTKNIIKIIWWFV